MPAVALPGIAFAGSDTRADTRHAADTVFEAGLLNRRRVLGDAWVDASLAKRTDFTAEFHAMITRIAGNEIWGRPGLGDRSRRFIVLAITVALGRWEEFALHVRAGLMRDGFTREELKEVLMQSAIYAGGPAANTAFSEAGKIIAELDFGSDKDRIHGRRFRPRRDPHARRPAERLPRQLAGLGPVNADGVAPE